MGQCPTVLFYGVFMSEIKILRLTTGEELLTTVLDNGDSYSLSDVSILIPTESNSLGLAPFMAYSTASEKGLDVKKEFVMFVTEPVPALKQQYQNMFSKIMVPDSNIVTK